MEGSRAAHDGRLAQRSSVALRLKQGIRKHRAGLDRA
jgi:hypothetical protein